jgi:MoaA/NifB/PqqE/SkfB family radical SAM enzyme
MLSDVCNTQCIHCYKQTVQPNIKNVLQCKKEIGELKKQGHKIIVAGNEILMDLRYLEIYEFLEQDYILSNGILLAEKEDILLELVSHGIKKVHISWHFGFQNILNKISEDVIKKAINKCLKAGLMVRVNCVISNKNCFDLKNICQQVVSIGAKELQLFQLLPVGPDLFRYQLLSEDKGGVVRMVKEIRNVYKKEELKLSLHPNFSSPLSTKGKLLAQEGKFCPAGKDFCTISTDNKVYPCPFLMSPDFQIGFWDGHHLKISDTTNDGRKCLAEKLLVT